MTQQDEVFERIFAKRADRIHPTLDRVRQAWQVLGAPARTCPTILVGGTNGKGSTSTLATSMLEGLGWRVGRYTSPHLHRYSERFYVSGVARPTDATLIRLSHEVQMRLGTVLWDALSFFEVSTLIALCWFAEAQVDVAVVEVGLGGRWDATNILDPRVSVVTQVALDHQEYLGNSILAIAMEKIMIARSGRPLILGDPGSLGADLHAVRLHAEATLGARWVAPDEYAFEGNTRTLIRNAAREWPEFLRKNLRTAATAVDLLLGDLAARGVSGRRRTSLDQLPDPWDGALPPGRFELRTLADPALPPVLFDVCHNPDGARAFAEAVGRKWPQAPHGSWHILLSPLGDKDVSGLLRALLPLEPKLFFFPNPSPRTATRIQLDKALHDVAWTNPVVMGDDFGSAWRHALASRSEAELSTPRADTPILIVGSCVGVGMARVALGLDPG